MIIRNIKNDSSSCPHCAAPAVTRICPYCGQPTGLEQDIAIASMEYPVIDYQNVHYEKKVYLILTAFSFVFGILALLFGYLFFKTSSDPSDLSLMEYGIIGLFGIIAIGLFFTILSYTMNAYNTKKYGKDYTVLVMKDIDNKELGFGNTQGKKTVKLLIRTNKGYRIILHTLGYEASESYILKKDAVRIRYLKGKYMIAGI